MDRGNSYADREKISPHLSVHISKMLNMYIFGNKAVIFVIVHIVPHACYVY
jgi:hypothetical protein